MNNLPENENNVFVEDDFSTVFSNPVEHKNVDKKGKKGRLKIALALILVFVIALGGTLAVIKLIPEKETKTTSSYEDIMVLDCEDKPIKEVLVKNKNGSFKFIAKTVSQKSEVEGEEPTETTVWYMDGYDKSMTDSGLIENVVNELTYITAIREITTKTAKECGLEKPKVEACLKFEKEKITISIGDESPDNVGFYLKTSTSDKIYLVEEGVGENLVFTDLDMANTETEAPITLSDKYADYYSDDTLSRFDSLSISGINIPEKIVFEQNNNESLASYMPYFVVKPVKRTAENVHNLFSVFSTGFYVQGAYSYDVSKATLNSLGLNSPDFVLSATFGDFTYTYKFKEQKDGCYAYVGNDSKYVRKVSADDCGFLTCDPTYFYNKSVFLTSIEGVKNLTFITTDKTYSFDITKNPSDDEDQTYIIECDGKTYNSSNFQSFYQYLCGLQCMEFDVKKTSQKPDLSMIYTYNDKAIKPTKIDFVKLNATKYQYSIDGVEMGKVGSTSYKKILKYLEQVLDGKTIVVN